MSGVSDASKDVDLTRTRMVQVHGRGVYASAFFKDGRRVITGSGDKTLRIWDVQKGASVEKPFKGHKGTVRSIAISPDNRRIASGGDDATIIIWDVKRKKKVFKPLVKHTRVVFSVCFSPDGKRLASCSGDFTVAVWDAETGAVLRRIYVDQFGVFSVAFSPDGLRVASGSPDCTIRVWRTDNAQLLLKINAHASAVRSVVWSPDGQQLISASYDTTVKFWNSSNGDQIDQPCTGHTDIIYSLAISSDGSFIASASADRTVRLWSTKTHQHIGQAFQNTASGRCVAISPNGELLVSGDVSGKVRLWSINDMLEQRKEEERMTDDEESQRQQLVTFSDTQTRRDNTNNDLSGNNNSASNNNRLFDVSWLPFMRRVPMRSAPSKGKASPTHPRRDDRDVLGTDVRHGTDTGATVDVSRDRAPSPERSRAPSPNSFSVIQDDKLEAQQQKLRTLSGTLTQLRDEQPRSFEIIQPTDDHRSPSNHPSETDEASHGDYNYSLFVHRSKANFERNLYAEALHDAEKVIELNPSSYLGYELKHAALRGAQRYDDAIEAFKIMLSMLNLAPDAQIQKLCQDYVHPSEVEDAIRRVIHAQLENAPLRLLNTFTGHLCDRQAQINAFMTSAEYKEILSLSMTHAPLQTRPIKEAVAKYFGWVMLSHRWESKEPLLHDIQDKVIYNFDPVGTTVKLQKFCEVTRDAGYRWAWSDTCCIDQNNNAEVQRSVNSMFIWYRHSALTIVYLSDVPPSSKSGALANSVWNTRGWTVQEFLAPRVVLFYQANWTLYLNDSSPNHKESATIMQELEDSTGINAGALFAFRPGMRGAREKLQWASSRVTTLPEDIAYSLFGIFGIYLPVIYGETKQNALGRLLQEIVARSGDITALDWVGKSSEFNSCVPAHITSYKAPPCTLPSLPESDMQTSVSMLRKRNGVAVESVSQLYTLLDNLSAPRFANSRLQLPCIAFPVTEVRRRRGQDPETCLTYDVKADSLQDLVITTEDKLIQFSSERPTRQTFLLVRPWNRHDLGLPDFADEMQSVDEPESLLDEFLGSSPRDNEPANSKSHSRAARLIVRLRQPFGALLPAQQRGGKYKDSESYSRALRLVVRLGQPFGALLLAQQRGGEYKRIAPDNNIIARVRDMAAVQDMMDVRTLEIL